MKETSSIYTKRNPKLQALFAQAGNLKLILCVPLDFAKEQFMTLFCNGQGDILKKAFPVENSPEGYKQLLEEVARTCKHRSIAPQHVFFGGEDRPAYAENFIAQLTQRNYLFARVNAWEAKQLRDNRQASTDVLDLLGIAKCLLQHKGQIDAPGDLYPNLREVCRNRTYVVEQQTALKLRIHTYADRLFPDFLKVKHSGIPAFSQASLGLMKERFSPQQIQRRKPAALETQLQRWALEEPKEAAQKLQQLAAQVLAPASGRTPAWQASLTMLAQMFEVLERTNAAAEQEVAYWLAQSPGAFLTSIRGIGVVLAAGLTGELGHPTHWQGLRQLCSYCGVVPRVEQTGGPDHPAQTLSVHPRCNRRAKNWLVQCGVKMGEMGPPELQAQFADLEKNGQHAQFIMSKRFLRLAKDLINRQAVYRPKALLDPKTPEAQLKAHYLQLWPKLVSKWQGLCSLEHVFGPAQPLGQWRAMVQTMHKICLPLPKYKRG